MPTGEAQRIPNYVFLELFQRLAIALGWAHHRSMNACSEDLRKKIVEAKERGEDAASTRTIEHPRDRWGKVFSCMLEYWYRRRTTRFQTGFLRLSGK
jgi:hypothetical protein